MKSPDGTAVAHAGSLNLPSMLMGLVTRLARIRRRTVSAGSGVGDAGGGPAGCAGYVGLWAPSELEATRTASAARHRCTRRAVMEGERVDVAGDPYRRRQD